MTHPNLNVVLGPPGTGKTTTLLGIVQQELESGVRPDRIGFLAFTKKAASEATERACERFSYTPDQLPYFRTLHSLAYRKLGVRQEGIFNWRHKKTLANALGIEYKGSREIDDDVYGMVSGDRLMFLEELSRNQQRPLASVWEDSNEDIDYRELARYAEALKTYKDKNGLRDFLDMLQGFINNAVHTVPELDVVFLDEAQDFTALEWRMVEVIAARAKRVYIAGDDDQAIFRWKGADVDAFMGLKGNVSILGQSYRCSVAVHKTADGILRRMGKRMPKVWAPRTEPGKIEWYSDPEEVDLSKGSWLLLARNGYMLRGLEDMCRREGFSYTTASGKNPLQSPALKAITTYTRLTRGVITSKADATEVLKWISHPGAKLAGDALKKCKADSVSMTDLQSWGFSKNPTIWHQMLDKISESEREYFIAVRRRGETLTKTPRIKISTIHTAKGGEADHVLLMTGMSQRTYKEMDRDLDSELRCWYVAVTRARHGLHVVQSSSGNCFDI